MIKMRKRARTIFMIGLLFLLIIEFGYLCGTAHKIIYSMDWVIILYILNAVMILVDILLYYRNYLLERKTNSNTTI